MRKKRISKLKQCIMEMHQVHMAGQEQRNECTESSSRDDMNVCDVSVS